ncbi:hypothetical protein [Streptomyces catenulae]|uniref:Uncharacterized protein n=1 Tax=Streptomyces catenulae TaxID=66875 RepID=A0ABV2YZ30_9ACTN|nr:hypothetical protein [Streptomyces catenulae]
MTRIEATEAEITALETALYDALNPLVTGVRARETGLPAERMGDADPVDVTLSVLSCWKIVDATVERLTAGAARTAGSYGASYERLGAAWGITRQGARKKWPDAVERPRAGIPEPSTVELFGGIAELYWDPVPNGWRWKGAAADGTPGEADGSHPLGSREEAAAYAGAFLKEHAGGG